MSDLPAQRPAAPEPTGPTWDFPGPFIPPSAYQLGFGGFLDAAERALKDWLNNVADDPEWERLAYYAGATDPDPRKWAGPVGERQWALRHLLTDATDAGIREWADVVSPFIRAPRRNFTAADLFRWCRFHYEFVFGGVLWRLGHLTCRQLLAQRRIEELPEAEKRRAHASCPLLWLPDELIRTAAIVWLSGQPADWKDWLRFLDEYPTDRPSDAEIEAYIVNECQEIVCVTWQHLRSVALPRGLAFSAEPPAASIKGIDDARQALNNSTRRSERGMVSI